MKPTLIFLDARSAGSRIGWGWGVVLVTLLCWRPAYSASPAVARKLYDTGRYDAAQAEYQKLLREKPDDARLHYNSAASAYKKGDYAGAALGFESALATQDLKLQQQAYYNFGNTLYQLGEKSAAPDEKMGHWEQALKSFGSALTLKPEDADARNNQALVQRMLEELKQQMPKQKQPSKDKDDKQDKEEQKQEQQDPKDQKDQRDEKDSRAGDKDQQPQQPQPQDKPGEDSKEPQPGAGEDGKDEKEKQAGEKQGAGKQEKKDAQAERDAEEERQAAAIGKMTPQMAEKLLDAQKGNEKAMLFRVQQQPKAKSKDRVFKDW